MYTHEKGLQIALFFFFLNSVTTKRFDTYHDQLSLNTNSQTSSGLSGRQGKFYIYWNVSFDSQRVSLLLLVSQTARPDLLNLTFFTTQIFLSNSQIKINRKKSIHETQR